MTVGDLIFYVFDAAILYMLYRMYNASKTIEVKTTLGPRWVIPALFWAIALLGLFNYSGAFRWIQTILLAVMGGIYWQMDSGLSPKGIVMIGRLYPYEKTKPITRSRSIRTLSIIFRSTFLCRDSGRPAWC